jgi:glucose/arabinose dehydrogenase
MRGRTASFIAATIVSTGAMAATATAASGPPPPPTATNGAVVQQVAAGLNTPTSFAFGGGSVFEGDGGSESGPPNGGVFLLKNGVGTKIPGSPAFVAGLVWHKGTLYVSGGTPTGPKSATWQLLAWSGWNGTTFTKQKAIYTAPKKFQGFNGLAFGPDGRLYVGVDVGLLNNNDHGPASTSPYVYSILSIAPNGKGLKVYAKGIRQPWQFVFPAGSRSPLVSDLGQDKGAKNPPDFILKVAKGDNYGFPKCNWTKGSTSKCKGFTKPSFKQFAPHTDIMGLAIIGSQLYMTSFAGPGGKGPGGQVLSMPVKGGSTKVLLKGFVAPIVGLGASGGWLYVGETTGQIFRVKP